MAEEHDRITLKRFLAETGLALEEVYAGNHSWSDLLKSGGVATLPTGPYEEKLRRALGRLLHVDDPCRLQAYRAFAESPEPPRLQDLDLRARRLFHMLCAVLLEGLQGEAPSLDEAAALLWQRPQVLAELAELVDVLEDRVTHLQSPLSSHPEAPLLIHARYTRREILAAFSAGEASMVPAWREGVRWLPDERVDLLAFTLDKSSGRFSPTTRYRDYAISRQLIHWESQSTTRESSNTGKRYQCHTGQDSTALLFARLTLEDKAFWLLGPGTYVSHEGERPMAIQWRLQEELPGDLFMEFAAAVS